MRTLLLVTLLLAGCSVVSPGTTEQGSMGAEPLRGFSVAVDEAVAARVPMVHLRVCGGWGCHEQDVPLMISGPTSAAPCATGPSGAAGDVCGVVHLPGAGPGYGYAPVPQLTADPVTVTVTTPPGAPMAISAELRVTAPLVCRDQRASACADGVPQANLRIAADGTVGQRG
ncbi:hypothetical protein [Dactylosporangium sp. NPDC005555]|uniref:hypothetical protein n=1 Tax=Dactylosporangium sp. NPDC005555 TaxID=3154889 RepID=UPI0033B43B57